VGLCGFRRKERIKAVASTWVKAQLKIGWWFQPDWIIFVISPGSSKIKHDWNHHLENLYTISTVLSGSFLSYSMAVRFAEFAPKISTRGNQRITRDTSTNPIGSMRLIHLPIHEWLICWFEWWISKVNIAVPRILWEWYTNKNIWSNASWG